MNVISGIAFLHSGAGSAAQPDGKKAENAIARERPADKNFDLEQGFKKITEFFFKLIDRI